MTGTEVLKAFKTLAYSRGYKVKIVGDWGYRKKRGQSLIHLIGSQKQGTIMTFYDSKIKHRETASVVKWLPKYKSRYL